MLPGGWPRPGGAYLFQSISPVQCMCITSALLPRGWMARGGCVRVARLPTPEWHALHARLQCQLHARLHGCWHS